MPDVLLVAECLGVKVIIIVIVMIIIIISFVICHAAQGFRGTIGINSIT